MELIILILPFIGPVAAVYISRRLGWRSIWLQLLAAGIVGAASGAFLANAASALSTASNSQAATLRGAGVGLLFGLAVGGLTIGAASFRKRLARKTD